MPQHPEAFNRRGSHVAFQLEVVSAVEEAAAQQKARSVQRLINGLLVVDQLGRQDHLCLRLTIAPLRAEEPASAIVSQVAGRVERVRRTLARGPAIDVLGVGVEPGSAVLPQHASVTKNAARAEVVKQALDQTGRTALGIGRGHPHGIGGTPRLAPRSRALVVNGIGVSLNLHAVEAGSKIPGLAQRIAQLRIAPQQALFDRFDQIVIVERAAVADLRQRLVLQCGHGLQGVQALARRRDIVESAFAVSDRNRCDFRGAGCGQVGSRQATTEAIKRGPESLGQFTVVEILDAVFRQMPKGVGQLGLAQGIALA
ncbi:hypothetical protein D3C84_608580 [compost metagenome]